MIFQVSSSHPLAAALVPCSGHTPLPPTPVPHPRVSKTQLTPNVFKHLDTLLGTSICILTHQIIRDDLKRCQWTRLKTSVGLEEFAGWPRSLPYGSARPRPPTAPTPPYLCGISGGPHKEPGLPPPGGSNETYYPLPTEVLLPEGP